MAKKGNGKQIKWTKEKIKTDIEEIYSRYPNEFNMTFLDKNYPKLRNAIYRIYGSFKKAIDESGIDFKVQKITHWNFENIKMYIELDSESGCELISKEFTKYDDKNLTIKCKCGEIFTTSFAYFKGNNKQQCDQCGLRKGHDQFAKEIHEKFKDNISVEERYISSLTPIEFSCKIHGAFVSSPNAVLGNKKGCPSCGIELISQALSKGERECCVCGSKNKVQEFNKTGKNYCGKHYNQLFKYGKIKEKTIKDKNQIIELDNHAEIILMDAKLNETGRALVSLDVIDKIKDYKWYLMKGTDYIATRTYGKHILLHRLIMDVNEDEVVDHINRIRTDCRNENLRKCTQSQNAMNSSISKRNTSGVTGVWKDKRSGKWVAEIFENGNKHRLGSFINIQDAINARRNAEELYFGEFTPDRGDSYS